MFDASRVSSRVVWANVDLEIFSVVSHCTTLPCVLIHSATSVCFSIQVSFDDTVSHSVSLSLSLFDPKLVSHQCVLQYSSVFLRHSVPFYPCSVSLSTQPPMCVSSAQVSSFYTVSHSTSALCPNPVSYQNQCSSSSFLPLRVFTYLSYHSVQFYLKSTSSPCLLIQSPSNVCSR